MNFEVQSVNFICNYPFGWVMPGRELVSANKYRFGYQGEFSEKDDETGWNSFELRSLDTRIGRWMTTDPKYQYWSPFISMGNNPVNGVDPDGGKFINFDVDGNYVGTTKDNWFHNFFVGTKGRVANTDGSFDKFKFADPKFINEHLEAGETFNLIRVNKQDVFNLMEASGVWEARTTDDRMEYIYKEGQSLGKMDYSFLQIPQYFNISFPSVEGHNPAIFLIGNKAHNHMNFGNFLLGAGAQYLNISMDFTALAGHFNSVFFQNGYSRSGFDSNDDQRSIRDGWRYSYRNDKPFVKVGRISTIISP